MKRLLVMPFVLSVLFMAQNVSGQTSYSERRELSPFNGVKVYGAAQVVINPSDSYELVIEGGEDDVRNYLTEIRDGVLCIEPFDNESERSGLVGRLKSGLAKYRQQDSQRKVSVRVSAPVRQLESALLVSSVPESRLELVDDIAIEGTFTASVTGNGRIVLKKIESGSFVARVTGSGDILTDGVISKSETRVTMSGSGEIRLNDVEADYMKTGVSGSGAVHFGKAVAKTFVVQLSGSGQICGDEIAAGSEVRISNAGSGLFKSGAIRTADMRASISGSGIISIFRADIEDSVNLSIAGSGSISLDGKAGKTVANVSGSGRISGNLECADIECHESGNGRIRFNGK